MVIGIDSLPQMAYINLQLLSPLIRVYCRNIKIRKAFLGRRTMRI